MIVVGVDEVGRGCWAGPLVAAAVVLKSPIEGLKDSKKLSKLQRGRMAQAIKNEASAIGIGWVWPETIDTVGITESVRLAMKYAVANIQLDYDELIVDGNINYFAENPKATALVRADDLIPSVSAASIIAKVARDNYMAEADTKFPGYGFASHVGYGTAAHIAALQRLGVSQIHRLSYKPIQALLE